MKNIVLVGFMGAGKTTIGKLLARNLNRPFIDIDRKIEAYCKMTVSDIFRERGEAFFRQQESLIIRELLPQNNTVIATGGGAVLFPENVENLKKHGIMICLQATVDVIINRIGKDANRPLLNTPDREQVIANLLQERASRYQLADHSIDTNLLTPEEVADRIINILVAESRYLVFNNGVSPLRNLTTME